MKMLQKKILVIVAHPDDEVLGCGGTIVKHVLAGDEVSIIVLADGVTSRYYDPNIKRAKEEQKYKRLINIRLQEFFAAVSILGVKKNKCHCLGYPDQRLDALPMLDIIKRIENASKEINPDIIYTHHWGDLNMDHRICYEASMTAFRPSKKINEKKSIYCFEINGNMDFLAPLVANKFQPNHFIDVTACIQVKIKALKAYASEPLVFPSLLSPENIMALAIRRGRKKNFKYAEAFERAK